MQIKLSNNFTVQECQYSDYAKRHNLLNIMPAEFYKNAALLSSAMLEPIRSKYGAFSPLSWFRSPEVNKGVGGSKTSDHMIGAAVDIRISGIPLLDLAKWIADNLEFDQLILEPNWVHISYKHNNNRKQVLSKAKIGYTAGLTEK